MDTSFYVGDISIGHPPQVLQVVFDTSSGNVLLPHRACRNQTCTEHLRYSPWESSTSMDVDINGEAVQTGHRLAQGKHKRDGVTLGFTQSDLGEGEAHAVVVRDSVCVGGPSGSACVDMAVLAATKMDARPFRFMPSDGIIGLGLSGLTSSPLCSFFGNMVSGSSKALHQFGLALGARHGELHLGGHDSARLASPLHWFPVDHPEAGFWQVAIQAVRVGNLTVDDCQHGCHGVIDSAVSRLGIQSSKMPAMRSALALVSSDKGACRGPDISFDLGGMILTLKAHDYSSTACIPLLGSLNLPEPEFIGVYALGATLLRRYYAAFDWDQQKLGFAPLARPDDTESAKPGNLEGVLLV
jgi:hypothetical protein